MNALNIENFKNILLRDNIKESVLDEMLEELKEKCFSCITTKNDEFFTEMLEYYQLILLKNKKLAFTVIKHLGIIGCLAIKNTRFTIALNAGNFILSIIEQFNDESEIKILALKIMQNLLSMSMRMRNSELFILLLTSTSKTYLSLKTFEEYKEALKFLNAIYFKVADRRIKEAFSLLNSMGIILAQKEFQEIKCLKVFVLELTQLIAQMAKRKWDKEAEQLLENLFIFLYKNKKFELIYFAILNLSLHFKIYADWDGFKNALRVYAIWQRIMALLLELAINKRYLPAESLKVVSVILSVQCDLAIGIARHNMMETMDIYKIWFEELKNSKHFDKKSIRMLQMTVAYWGLRQPKTSKKQLKHLQYIFEDNLMKPNYIEALNKLA